MGFLTIGMGKFTIILKIDEKYLPNNLKFAKIIDVQFIEQNGDIGEGVNTADCGSVMQGFESLMSPH